MIKRIGVKSWPAIAGLIAGTLGCGPPAAAYSYQGPRAVISACAQKLNCSIDATAFAVVSVQGGFTSSSVAALADFTPSDPSPRGGVALKQVVLFARSDGVNLRLNVRRSYVAAGRAFDVDYLVTDPLVLGVGEGGTANLDLTIYMSANQIWIESHQGPTSLGPVWTVPLFFGFGPSTGGTVMVGVVPTTSMNIQYYTADVATLVKDVNAQYAALPDTTPFLFQGSRQRAAALATALQPAPLNGAGL